MKNLSLLLVGAILSFALAACGSAHDGEVQIPLSSADAEGMNYKDVVAQFESAGLPGIRLEGTGDLILGVLHAEGEVESVSVGGKTDFASGDWVDDEAQVVVRFHSYEEFTGTLDQLESLKAQEAEAAAREAEEAASAEAKAAAESEARKAISKAEANKKSRQQEAESIEKAQKAAEEAEQKAKEEEEAKKKAEEEAAKKAAEEEAARQAEEEAARQAEEEAQAKAAAEEQARQEAEAAAAAAAEAAQQEASAATSYVINTNTGKFHRPGCSSVMKIKDVNRWDYTGTRDDVINMGYEPCKNCNP